MTAGLLFQSTSIQGSAQKPSRQTCLLINIFNGKFLFILYISFQGIQPLDLGLRSRE